MEYPKYTRKQNKAIKLQEVDIAEIKKLYTEGHTIASIAKKFKVVKSTPRRYLFPEEARLHDEQTKKWQKEHRDKKKSHEVYKKFLARKKKFVPAYRKWVSKIGKNYKEKNPEEQKAAYDRWYKEHGAKYYGIKRG